MATYVPLPYPGRLPTRLRKLQSQWERKTPESMRTPEKERAHQESLWEQMCYDSWVEGQMKAMKEKAYQATIEKSTKYLVTVNPHHDTSIENLVTRVDKWVKQKHITNVEYVYEQGSDTIASAGHHPHVHAIVETNTNFKDLVKRTSSTFKDIIGSDASIDVKPFHGNAENYIRGKKVSKAKQAKVLVDIYWRNINNLRQLYILKNGVYQEEAHDQETCDIL